MRAIRRKLLVAGRLDRYVATLFCASYSVAFFLVVGLFLIINLAGNLDEYFEPSADGYVPSGTLVVKFYLYSIPFIYLQVGPFVTLVAGLFTASKLVQNNEVVAALNAGVSAQRLAAPVLVIGALLAGGMFGLREWATESIGYRRDLVLDHIVERRPAPVYEEVWLEDPHEQGTNLVRIERFLTRGDGGRPTIEGLVATLKSADELAVISADRAVYEDTARGGRWRLTRGRRMTVEPPGEPLDVDFLDEVPFTPRDVHVLWKEQERPLDLSFRETSELWRRDPDNSQLQTLIEYLKTFPLANLVLLLVGLPFLFRYERGRRIEKVAGGMVLCVFYFAADFVTRSLGMQGVLAPLMASWLPVLFFGSLGVVLYGSMKT